MRGIRGRTAFFRQAASLRRRDERRETEALRKSPSGGTVHPDRNRHGKTRRVEGTAPRGDEAVPGPLGGRGGRQGKGDEAAPRGEEGRDGFTEPDRTFRLKHGGKSAQGKGRLRTAGLLLKRFLGRRWELVRLAFLSIAGSRLSSNSAAGAISHGGWGVRSAPSPPRATSRPPRTGATRRPARTPCGKARVFSKRIAYIIPLFRRRLNGWAVWGDYGRLCLKGLCSCENKRARFSSRCQWALAGICIG